MGREKDIEKKFTEYLDRILAGEEIQADPAMDEELRAALDFARKMTALRTSPSAQYRARLKASLLQKLGEREAQRREGQGSFWNVFRSHPVWQGAAAALFVIILVSIIWRAGYFQPSITAPTTAPPAATTAAPTTAPAAKPSPGTLISIDATADKSTYQPGETVKIELAMKNITTGQLTVTDFPPILSLMAAETGQPVYTFAAGKETRVLMPNEAARYTYTWPQVDFKGRPVSGSYYVELEDLEYQGRALQLNLNTPVKFQILR